MASWGMARRVAELSVFGVQIAAGKRFSVRLPLRGSFHHLSQRLMLSCFSSSSISASLHSLSAASERSVGFPRPDEIQWQRGLVNNVSLIGRINKSVDIKYLDSGKIVATTSIKVSRRTNDTDYTEFFLQFWDELAEIAAAHLKKEDRVYVAGSVWVESYMDKDNQSLSKSICKVVARDLKFVGPMHRTSNDPVGEVGTEHEETRSVEDLWRDYFKNPSDFWDNRLSKKNIKGPDFKHKSTGASLWIDSRSTPSWVHEELDQAPPTKGEKAKEMEKLWQVFFADPLEWWDNRDSKKTPAYPDFKNKSSGEALWIESSTTPSWVKSQLELLDSKTKSLKEGGGQSEWQRSSKGRTPKTSIDDEDLMFF